MSGEAGGSQSPEVRKMYKIAKDLTLTRDERIDLSQYLLRRSITSWKELDEHQVRRMLDAMEGAELIAELLAQRP